MAHTQFARSEVQAGIDHEAVHRAASILLLEDRGKLKTDDPIKKYMPDAPAAWDKITIFNLLTHTSGIPSFTGFPDYRTSEATPTTPEQLVARFRDKPLEFQPGEKWNYSNSGYVLLGYLIEKISGQSYKAFVQENIFKPLGMNDSGYDSNSTIIPQRTSGYTPGPNGPVCRLYRHEHSLFGRRSLFHNSRSPALGAGAVWRQAALCCLTEENDHAFQRELRVWTNGKNC
jgi:CubicO group peptidase (beta-lactamase class C family)